MSSSTSATRSKSGTDSDVRRCSLRRVFFLSNFAHTSEAAFVARWEALCQERRLAALKSAETDLRRSVGDLGRSLSWRLSHPLRLADAARRGFCRFVRSSDGVEDSSFRWLDPLKLSKEGPELAIDVSRVIGNDCGTGIQRVVRNIAKELVAQHPSSVVALDFRHGDLQDLPGLFADLQGSRPRPLRAFRRLLMLDSSWDVHQELPRLWSACAEASIPVINCVHDLIPIDFPEQTSGDLPKVFRSWLDLGAEHGEAFVCVSKSTAQRLERYLTQEYRGRLRAKKIGWWRLGSDLEAAAKSGGTERFLVPPGNYVLCVGTLEPRKNQRFLLEEFSKRWKEENYPVSLVFAGRDGWKTEDLVCDIENHAEFGHRLWWFRGVEDSHLQELYRGSAAVVMASSAEGFGLPVVEAARFGKPLVLTDIPVFHEVADSDAYFFTVNDGASLLRALDAALAPDAAYTRVQSKTWRESAEELYDLIVNDRYQLSL